MRYFLKISYKGTNYSGWQIQDNANTVQAEIHAGLSTLLKTSTECMGAGRTDAGVHALGMIAHFDSEVEIDLVDFNYKLNAILPRDIAVIEIKPVVPKAHARFDAVARSYEYRIHNQKDPFNRNSSYFFNQPLDMNEINEGIEILKRTSDFESFSKVHTEVNNFNCEIFEAHWERSSSGHVFFIRANRFLRGMVRTIVGSLLDLGTKKYSPAELETILNHKDRTQAGRSVPADGLYFVSAEYPKEIYL